MAIDKIKYEVKGDSSITPCPHEITGSRGKKIHAGSNWCINHCEHSKGLVRPKTDQHHYMYCANPKNNEE